MNMRCYRGADTVCCRWLRLMTSVTVVVVVVVVGVGVVSTLLKGKHRTHHSGFYPRDAILARY